MNSLIETEDKKITLRFAEEKDINTILELIRGLAEHVKSVDALVATEEILKESLFQRKVAEVILVEYENIPVGYTLFFHNFSTFLGKPGIYMEDLYVKPEMRGKGLGKILVSTLAKLAKERDCGRLEWSCLDWNEGSIEFYKSLDAKSLDDSTKYRLADNTLTNLARNNK